MTTEHDRRAHRRALALMVLVPTLWSVAGVVTRHLSPELQAHGRYEITFWRSLFAALTVAVALAHFRREGFRASFATGVPGLVSGAMWAVMFSAFMLALTLTTTANTLLVLSLAPLVTAILARLVLRARIPARTWIAIVAAMIGMGWMFSQGAGGGPTGNHLLGMLIAFSVPLASAINLVTLQKTRAQVDLVPSVLLGGVFSALLILPFALPLRAAPADIALLALLGIFQLGVPCMLMVVAARSLTAPEVSLLALLEVVLGPLWAWLGAGEVPSTSTLYGGAIVLAALIGNELVGLRSLAPRARDAT
jgi:drug/metabolite transporter (DMT)-like permease